MAGESHVRGGPRAGSRDVSPHPQGTSRSPWVTESTWKVAPVPVSVKTWTLLGSTPSGLLFSF